MNDDSGLIGRRIAALRRERGLTQEKLAAMARVSPSLLQKVETGGRDASQVLVAAVATAFDVDNTVLTGQPYDRQGSKTPDRVHDHMPKLRRALAHWDLPPELGTLPRRPSELVHDAAKLATLYQLDRHVEVAKRLPGLLLDGFALLHDSDDEQERELLHDALLGMFYIAHATTYQAAHEDLSLVVEERIRSISERSPDPTAAAFAAWIRTTSLMRVGAYSSGTTLLDRAISALDPGGREDEPALRMMGSLHLRSAILTARDNKPDESKSHIAEARQLAVHLNTDTDNDWRNLCFGPSNVGIHGVAARVESGDGAGALTLAEDLRLPAQTVKRLPIRAAHHKMDIARAYLWEGKYDKSLASLAAAKTLAPEQTRRHPTTREVATILVSVHNRANEPLARFHAWLGGPEL